MKSYKCYTTHIDCNGSYCKRDAKKYMFEFIDETNVVIESGSLGDAIDELKSRYGENIAWTITYHKREVK